MSKDGVMVHEQIEIEGMDDEHENEKRKTKMHLQKAKKHSLEIPFVLSFTVSLKVPNHLKLTFQLLRSYFGVWSCFQFQLLQFLCSSRISAEYAPQLGVPKHPLEVQEQC